MKESQLPDAAVATASDADGEQEQAWLAGLMARVAGLPPVRCAVVHPCDESSLAGALDAARQGLIVPVLVGPRARLFETALGLKHSAEPAPADPLHGIEIVDVPHSHAAAECAALLAAQGRVEILLKGSLHSDELLQAVLAQPGLRTARRMSHVFRLDVPRYAKPLYVTDAALNIAPSLLEKADIVRNAIELAQLMGVAEPKVALLAAVETVNPAMPSTVDAAALCKMADRGQIQGGVLDGPLAFDNAISAEAARIKGIRSPVAGQADILVVPDIEAGNILAKQLEYLAGAHAAGIVLGARVPVALTSRADSAAARVASLVLAVLVAMQLRQDPVRRLQLAGASQLPERAAAPCTGAA